MVDSWNAAQINEAVGNGSIGGGGGSELPEVTASDNGSVLKVINGAWGKGSVPTPSGVLEVVDVTLTTNNEASVNMSTHGNTNVLAIYVMNQDTRDVGVRFHTFNSVVFAKFYSNNYSTPINSTELQCKLIRIKAQEE